MIRVSKHSLKFSNKEKIQKLEKFFELYKLTLIDYIIHLVNLKVLI